MRSWLVIALAACGPSNAEIKTAKEASYNASLPDMIEVAKQAISDEYKVAGVDQGDCVGDEGECTAVVASVRRFYGPEGDLQSSIGSSPDGRTEFVHMTNGTVGSAFLVKLHRTAAHAVIVEVVPDTFQYINTPQPRPLAPDDPNLPPFIHGRADALAARIYDLGKKYVVAAPPGH